MSGRPRMTLATAPNPGAVGLINLCGDGVEPLLARLTGVTDWSEPRMRLVRFGDIDRGLAAALRPDWAQLMPHGGPRVVQKLAEHLHRCGAVYDEDPSPAEQFPESSSPLQADMLATIARARSPAAIDLLIAQEDLWRRWWSADPDRRPQAAPILARSDTLDRLVDAASVVVVGRPNVGKSTLSNRMLGRSASVVADVPGTTRDWVSGLAELRLAPRSQDPGHAVAVRWLDTPGLRTCGDPIERCAIELAEQVVVAADVLIAMRDPGSDWPARDVLRRDPDLWVLNKIDVASAREPRGSGDAPTRPRAISAADGTGTASLEQSIVDRLGLQAIDAPLPWAFSPTLRRALTDTHPADLRDYL